jgi:hypothetical protein
MRTKAIRPRRRVTARLLLVGLAAAAAGAGCTLPPAGSPPAASRTGFDSRLQPAVLDISAASLDLRVTARDVVPAASGESLLRVRFSFVSYEDWIGEGEAHRSTGTLFAPADESGRVRPARLGEVVITEFPPGASASGLSIQPEYGERPAEELGATACVIDLRGPVVASLREYANPSSPDAEPFRSEEQFGYSMLHAYQSTGDPALLYEQQVTRAWLRALRAVDAVLADETGVDRNRFLLVGEGYGAIAAAQAAAFEPRVEGLVLCGWPLDRADLQFTRWRRWERQARYYPLSPLQPIPYVTCRDVLSFLFSTYTRPDPGCPSCEGSGSWWRSQYDYLRLLRDGRLDGVETLVLVGDSDPRFPLDLEARATVSPEALTRPLLTIRPGAPLPRGGQLGPYSGPVALPFRDMRYLRGAPSTLANREAVESVLAWIQHLAGFRDVPVVSVFEAIEGGDVRVEVAVAEGNAPVTGVEIRVTQIDSARDSDFKWAVHRTAPEPVRWRRVDAIYSGPDERFVGRWKGYFPFDPTRNAAYYIVVRDRVGDLETAHSLPARPLWHLGDPAVGPARL